MSTVQSVPADELSPCQPDQLTTKQQNIRFNFQLWCVWVQELFVSTIGALLSSSIRGNTFHFLSCRWWWEGSSRQTINLSDVFVRCCPWTITTQSWCHYYTSLEYITFFRFCKQKLGFTNMVITAFKMSETVGHIELLIVPSKTRQDCRWGGWWDVNGEKGRVSRGDYSGGEDGRYWGIMNAVKIWDPEIFLRVRGSRHEALVAVALYLHLGCRPHLLVILVILGHTYTSASLCFSLTHTDIGV